MSDRQVRAVSNSFDYVAERRLRAFRLDVRRCSAVGLGLSRLGSSRLVVVRHGGGHILCRTRTEDFDDAEIRRTVHACGQLYLDRAGAKTVQDSRDLQQLAMSPTCRSCPELPTCVAVYEPLGPGPTRFEEDETWIAARLGALRGRALDVGMGRLPYLPAVADALRAGHLEYHGLDPAPDAGARLAGLPVVVHRLPVERFEPEPGGFDHVLAIRSLHHVADLGRAFEVVCRALRPGGLLLLVESLPLPLVRSRADAEACRGDPRAGFEHHRNWGSEETLSFLVGRFPLRTVRHRPVGRDTCDQWILELRREEGA